MKKTLLFPGQGSQVIGMGLQMYENFPEAKEAFQEVDDCLQRKLSNLIFYGDQAELTLTANAQPAIMAVSIAILRVVLKQSGMVISKFADSCAGHSLGEYSALCAAQVFSLGDTAKLLQIRGDNMHAAASGSMLALLGATPEDGENLAKQASAFGVCGVANDNGAQQIVLSETKEAIQYAFENYQHHNIKRAIILPVSAPFHSQLMQPVAAVMYEALESVAASLPQIPVYSNTEVAAYASTSDIKASLVKQVYSKVRWRETMELAYQQGTRTWIEIGPGKVLGNIANKMFANCKVINISNPTDLENFLNNKDEVTCSI